MIQLWTALLPKKASGQCWLIWALHGILCIPIVSGPVYYRNTANRNISAFRFCLSKMNNIYYKFPESRVVTSFTSHSQAETMRTYLVNALWLKLGSGIIKTLPDMLFISKIYICTLAKGYDHSWLFLYLEISLPVSALGCISSNTFQHTVTSGIEMCRVVAFFRNNTTEDRS